MTPEQRKQIETQIQNDFAEIQKTLENLKNEVKLESDEAKKQEKNEEINRLESEAAELKTKIDTLKLLNEQELESLKTRLESFKAAIHHFR
jgi:cob(I)alamin adenosyltransferase